MRVLVISHNVISETNNMGKTLLSYFQDFSPDELAEFYIQEKEPRNATVCQSYFRVTDRDALKSVFGKKVGTEFHIHESTPEGAVSNASGAVEAIRQYGRKKSPLVFALRNSIWSCAHWDTPKLRAWLKNFDPEVIFFLAGDYRFMNHIALRIQSFLKKPMIACWVDDYYFYNLNEDSWMGRLLHRSYKKSVHRVAEKVDCILTISDSMSEVYQKQFGTPCYTLHTNAKRRNLPYAEHPDKVAYFGNLDFLRYENLSEIGKNIRKLGLENLDGIDVFSAEKNPDNLRGLTEENGVHFRGEISPSEVGQRMSECLAVIHTESFNEKTRKMVKYSVSTKIADTLLNGPCLIAYGPPDVASIEYLQKHHAAYCITRPEDLESGLREILGNADLRAEIVKNARTLAAQNHDASIYPKKVRAWLQDAIDRTETVK